LSTDNGDRKRVKEAILFHIDPKDGISKPGTFLDSHRSLPSNVLVGDGNDRVEMMKRRKEITEKERKIKRSGGW
jgi:hypothetical protein